jgi:SLT domain-containing protein/uncharacterized protein YlxW (UPF0749 family)
MAFDAGAIEARLTINRDDFDRGLRQAQADASKFSRGEYKASLKADNDSANRSIDDSQGKADKFGKTKATAKIGADNASANRAIDDTSLKLDKLGTKRTTIKWTADKNSQSQLAKDIKNAFGLGLKDADKNVSDAITKGGSDGATKLPGILGGVLESPGSAAAIAGAVAVSAPFIAQIVSGALVTGLGAGLAALGVIGAAKSKQIQAEFAALKNNINADLADIGKPFIPVLSSILKTANTEIGSLSKTYKAATAEIAPAFQSIGDTLIRSFGSPQVKASIMGVADGFTGILHALQPQIPGDVNAIADGVTHISQAVAQNPQAFADFASFLAHLAGGTENAIAGLTKIASAIEGVAKKTNLFGQLFHEIPQLQGVSDLAHGLSLVGSAGKKAGDGEKAANVPLKQTQALAREASTAVTSLSRAWQVLVGNFASSDQVAVSTHQAFKTLEADIAKTGANSLTSRGDFDAYISQIQSGISTLKSSGASNSRLNGYLQTQINRLKSLGPLNSSEQAALRGLQRYQTAAANSIAGMTKQQQLAAKSMENDLIPDLKKVGADSASTKKDVDNLVNSVINTGTKSSSTHSDRAQLIADLEKSGVSAQNATKLVNSFIKRIGAIPSNKAFKLTMTGTGVYKIGQQVGEGVNAKPGPGGGYARGTAGAAPGWAWVGERGPELVRMRGGETVLPHTQSVRMAGIPGYAAGTGGLAESGNSAVLSGQYAVTMTKQFEQRMTAAMVTAMRTALSSAEKTALAASSAAAAGKAGAGVQQWKPNVLAMLAQAGLPASYLNDVLYQMQTESGGNPTIVNRTDSNWAAGHPSVGLMQVIRGTFQEWAGPYRGTGPFEYGVSVNPDANIYAALEYAKHGGGFGSGSGQIGSGHGYAAGAAGAAPGWAWVGERGPELVRMVGGETVLPHAQSLMYAVPGLGGYAAGTGAPKQPKKPVKPKAASGQYEKDSAALAKAEHDLTALRKKAAARIKQLEVPVDRDTLYRLDHPGLDKSKLHTLDEKIDKEEAAVKKYRTTTSKSEDTLTRKIDLLKKLVAADSKPKGGPAPKVPKQTKKQMLATLAKEVTKLAAVQKAAKKKIAALKLPISREQLYLLQHPGLSASKRASLNAEIDRQQAALTKYRKAQTKSEDTIESEIKLLRGLTGNPAAAKYGGAGTTSDDTGSGGAGGDTSGSGDTGDATPSTSGTFVGVLPGAPAAFGGSDITGGGSGGLGGTGSSGQLVSLPSAPGFAAPGSEHGFGSNFSVSGAGIGQGGVSGLTPLPGAGTTGGSSVETYLAQLVQLARTNPAQTGGLFAQGLNGVSRLAYARSMFSNR